MHYITKEPKNLFLNSEVIFIVSFKLRSFKASFPDFTILERMMGTFLILRTFIIYLYNWSYLMIFNYQSRNNIFRMYK